MDFGKRSFDGPPPQFPSSPQARDFKEFCSEMTNYALNQVEYHREAYFEVSNLLYRKLMACYKEEYQTNDESEQWAKPAMDLADSMHISMVTRTQELNAKLEKWTDYWKGEADMEWINKWGKQYMDALHSSFKQYLHTTKDELEKIQ